MIVGDIEIKNPLVESKLSKKSLCDYVVNLVVGCLHGCRFCYVTSTPAIRMRITELMKMGVENPQLDWGQYIFYRTNAAEALEEALSKKRTWKETPGGRGVVMLCSTTDPFFNNRVGRISADCVKVLLKYNKRVRILTRSPNFLKYSELLANPLVTVGMSIPTLDDNLSRQLEPQAPRPSDRLKALQEASRRGVRTFVAIAPTVPQVDKEGFKSLIGNLMTVNPTIFFWEPINARGQNGKLLAAAGIEWAAQVGDRATWAENFERQYHQINSAADSLGVQHLIHPWLDQDLVNAGRLQTEVWERMHKPTIEVWPELQGLLV